MATKPEIEAMKKDIQENADVGGANTKAIQDQEVTLASITAYQATNYDALKDIKGTLSTHGKYAVSFLISLVLAFVTLIVTLVLIGLQISRT